MRRRRNADAPNEEANRSPETIADINRENTTEETPATAEPTTEQPVTAEPTARKGRRRAEGRTPRANALPIESAPPPESKPPEEKPAAPVESTASPSGEETPAPRRRRSGVRRKVEETPTEVEVAHLVNEVVPEPEPPAVTAPEPEKPARSGRTHRSKRLPVKPVENVEAPPVSAPPPVAPAPAEVRAATEEPAPEKAKRGRGRTRKGGGAAEPIAAAPTNEATLLPTAEAPETTAPVDRTVRSDAEAGTKPVPVTPPQATAPPPSTSKADTRSAGRTGPATPATSGPTSNRTRGTRQRLPARPSSPSVTSPPVVPPVLPTPPSPQPGAETPPAARRVRGLRRPVTRTVVAPAAPTPTVAPVEPPPPRYQPLPAETLARLAEGKVVVRKNVPELQIAGEPRVPLWFFVNTEDAETPDTAIRQIRMAYEAGIRIFTVLAHLPWKGRTGERRFDPLDNALQLITENAPDAFILPRLIFSPTNAWVKQHESEMTRYADGEIGDVSIASHSFWEGEAEEALRAAVEHIAQGPHAERVFGFYLEHGEWFYEKGRGYDLSDANRKGFRAWLRTRYRNNQVALRAAWFDSDVTFDKADIPDFPPAAGPTLFYSRREQRYRDYHEYASDIVAGVILNLGQAIKEASGGRSAVAVSYGYTLELPRAASGHLALAQVLESPNVDILTGPLSYTARTPGGSAPIPAPLDSINLAGKLWVSEDDTKTHLSSDDTPDTYNPRVESADSTWAVHSRNFGAALARGAGISYMDLWGQGWLEDREMWRGIGKLRAIAEEISRRRQDLGSRPAPDPEVAVIVDERVYFDVRADESLLGTLVTQQRDVLLRSGARLGFYLMSDLVKPSFPESVRLLIFLNAFRIPDAIRTIIRERFQSNGRTIAWLYGPGALEENQAELTEVLGLSVRLQSWGSKIGTQVLSNVRSPLTDAVRGQRIGEEVRCNPSFFVTDMKAQVLGEYVGSGQPSLVVRKHPRWQAVFVGETSLPMPVLRGIYRLAGVQTYTVDDDVAWIGDNLLCLHSAPGGGTNVYLPEEAALADLLTGEVLASDGYGARLSMPPRGTRLLFYGPAAEVARFGIDPRSGPPGLAKGELPVLPQVTFDEEPVAAFTPEDEALFAAALTENRGIVDKDEDDVEEAVEEISPAASGADALLPPADSDAGKKRRRRRRRRGRGGRESDLLDDATGEALGEDDSEEEGTEEEVPDFQVRVRPSLEELLPLSDVPVGTEELPPIPEEFLPLPDAALTEPEAAEETQRGRGRTRRGGASRRNRRYGGKEETETRSEETQESLFPPDTETAEASVNPVEAVIAAVVSTDNLPDVETGEVRVVDTGTILPVSEASVEQVTDAVQPETETAGTSVSPYEIFDDQE